MHIISFYFFFVFFAFAFAYNFANFTSKDADSVLQKLNTKELRKEQWIFQIK